MDDLDDELDLRHHRSLKPDVYYRCPNTESLDGALRNELEKNAASLIPMEIATEFVFSLTSTITISVAQQSHLDSLFDPAAWPQSIAVEYALCRDAEGKERLKLQRAIARSILETIQEIDGFKYAERQALNKEGSDGTRFKYVCVDSLQNRDRKANRKKGKGKEKEIEAEEGGNRKSEGPQATKPTLPTYDCNGAIYIKFSTKRDAIHVVYRHNPIHNTPVVDKPSMPAQATDNSSAPQDATNGTSHSAKPKKRKRAPKDHHVEVDTEFDDPDLDMSTSFETVKAPSKKKNGKSTASPVATKKTKKGKPAQSPAKSRKNAPVRELTPPPAQSVKGKCLRCREKGIKCNEVKPQCNQCRRGLWDCQYEVPGPKKRSKNGCVNCKGRKRKCTEERPSCAYCLKVDDDCTYQDYS
ncbi:hypothetical protein P280DRAFT_404552 [Massarina eburnea CBS 473.64]|uniref:Zn(2)-C6 fungal-type domain-containing protein n=1 Tax=Massarina eburnea CBS 473.64 TaxID=1395130 RepID=A0A6A6RWK2_9PLEO|nr:hypothetical protein P280DRAFT_404552 [Massarina eburnea CBS 473.64]